MNFSIELPCSPPVGQYQSSQNLYSVVTSYEFYDVYGMHFSMISANISQCLGDATL